MLEKKGDSSEEMIIGVHAPSCEVDYYWDALIKLHQDVTQKALKSVIIIGDMNMNALATGAPQNRYFNRLLSQGLVDEWLEAGNSHLDPTYSNGNVETRIDYALISNACCGKYQIFKEDIVRTCGCSDHSALVLRRKDWII